VAKGGEPARRTHQQALPLPSKQGRGKSFCSKCFVALPKELADALYKKMFAGYEEAYQAACNFLDAEKKRGRA
jgi:hypothetical protein